MTAAFKEFSQGVVKQNEKPSILQKLSRQIQLMKNQQRERQKQKTKDRDMSL